MFKSSAAVEGVSSALNRRTDRTTQQTICTASVATVFILTSQRAVAIPANVEKRAA